ncbi:MAG: RNA polymerase sigma factor [Prolixibacteraceae bacterium]
MDDLNQLIEDCKAGKQSAQSQLYKAFAPVLFGVCLRYARDVTEAEDTLHEGFLIIFNKIGQFAHKGSFEGWMKRIMVNIALEKFRKRFRLHTVEDMNVYDYKVASDDVYAQMNADQLMSFVQDLPPRYKMVFNLYAIDGYNHGEIADMMGIAEGTSKSNLSRARKILQDKIFECGYLDRTYAK